MGRKRIKETASDRIFAWILNLILILIVVVTLYPLIFVLSASVSKPEVVNSGTFLLFPKEISWEGYARIFNDSRIWTGYRNTILYTISGTALGVFSTLLGAYSLSRSDLVGRGWIMKLYLFTMYFSGGLIPTYLVVKQLKLTDTPYVLIVLGSISVYNIIIARSFFVQTIPRELFEAAAIDGCGNGVFFFRIVLPLSKAIVAVLALFYAAGHWNSYFNALIYVSSEELYPLQLILRDILVGSQMIQQDVTDMESVLLMQQIAEQIKYGVIVVSTLPMLILYPFVQKHFVKGVMIGSVKG